MDKNESFVYNEVDYETLKQSPQSNQTWPMDKIRQSRFQKKMSSLLSLVTPKWNHSISNARSLLLQCLRDEKSDPLPRRRIPVSCSDEGFLMDGVLVTSTSSKKVSDSPSSSLARSSIFRIQQKKNAEFNSPRSESGRDLSSPSVRLQTVMQNPDLSSPSLGPRTITINRDWLPSDDGLPTYTEAQLDDMLSDNKFLSVDIFGYKYTKRMPALEVDYSPFYDM